MIDHYLYPCVYMADPTGHAIRVPESNDGKSRADVIASYERDGYRKITLTEFVKLRADEFRREKEQAHV